jgi:hypothetical protein
MRVRAAAQIACMYSREMRCTGVNCNQMATRLAASADIDSEHGIVRVPGAQLVLDLGVIAESSRSGVARLEASR